MAEASIEDLELLLKTLTKSFEDVTAKKMFGCYALWVKDNVFALVWKEGRIGVKLPSDTSYSTLMRMAGAGPWKAGPMTISHWVLVPPMFHLKTIELSKWLLKAYNECAALENRPVKKAAKKVVKKAAKKVVKTKISKTVKKPAPKTTKKNSKR
jgi:TfoX/Sxy family transcriptional regulator of competence genes